MEDLRCAWKVTETVARRQALAVVEIARDGDFSLILYKKEGTDLNQAAEVLTFVPQPRTRYYLRVTVKADSGETAVSDTAYFETGKMDEPWTGQWIAMEEADTFHPVFSRDFSPAKRVAGARLYVTGLGLFTAELNGRKIGDEVLTPYYSNYRDEVQVMTYDITGLLEKENHLSVTLGNGWYKGRFGLAGQKENFGSRFMMIGEIHLDYTDGTRAVIPTDSSWTYAPSDTLASDLYDGETIDRLSGTGRAAEKHAVPVEAPGKPVDRVSLPVREMETLAVQEVITTPAGETVLDFGQNFAGYVAFLSRQPSGTAITLDFGEILQEGNFCNANYRSAKARFTYVSDGREEWVRPSFTYYGFRYVRVTGWTGEVRTGDFAGMVLYSDIARTGTIETGHAGINRLFQNALWGQKSNAVDFPTDCPQRDERLGWAGDAQVFAGTASYNMDTAAFYNKFIHDLRLEQEKLDGILPGVIPVFDPEAAIFSSVWGDIATFLPTVLYEHFGDAAALKRYYPMMRDWVDKITREDAARGQRYLFDYGNQLGDWLSLDGRTEQSMKGGTDDYFIASCYYAMSVQKTADAAAALGSGEDEARYRELYKKIDSAVLKEYFSETGRLCVDTQTGYITALYAGIYVDKERIVEGLKSRLYRDCYKIKGGFAGAPVMCRVLAENGLEEEAFYFLLQEGYPGWLHCVNLGATTIWERWNSVLDDGRLSGTMMNSLNHYAFGAVVEYLYRDVAGLKALAPGFKKALITPLVNPGLGYMKMAYDSPFGLYRSEWRILEDGRVEAEFEVPFGCSAVIGLPYDDSPVREVEAGVHRVTYQPTTDLRCRYTQKTLFKEMAHDPRAMEIIDRISPLLQHFLSSGDEEFLNESLSTIQGMAFLGFSEEVIGQLTEELTRLAQ